MPTPPPIHVISLARTQERLTRFEADNPALRDWRVFPAVDGTTVSAAERDALGDTSLWSHGGVGAALSQQRLWRLCVDSQTPITLCEDDAILRDGFVDLSMALISAVPDYDLILWGWNFDSIAEAEMTPGLPIALAADQGRFRESPETFRRSDAAAVPLRLLGALGTPCYTVSPKGAAKLLAKALPVGNARLRLPLMPGEIENVTPDIALSCLYRSLSAYLAFPPLAASRNEWSLSTVRLPAALRPEDALAEADRLEARGCRKEALEVIQSATLSDSKTSALWDRLGQTLAGEGLLNAAAAAFGRALDLQPEPKASRYNLARVYLLQGRWREALDLLDAALSDNPGFALAHSNRGVALLALGRAREARAAFRAATALDPRLVEARRGLAAADEAMPQGGIRALLTKSALAEREGRFQESLEFAQQACERDPDSPHAHNNLGVAHLRLGRSADAEGAFRTALALDPGFAAAHHGLAFALLKQRRWGEAWPEYEWRLRLPSTEGWTRSFGQPPWRGDRAPGARLLVVAEQGLGDTLQAACLIKSIRAQVGPVTVQAPSSLLRVLARLPGVDQVLDERAGRPEFDLWLPIMSLPGLLGVSPGQAAPKAPALVADPILAAAWARRLPASGRRIGVAWQGNASARVEHGRSFPLAALAPLADLAGVSLISLQKGHGADQLKDAPQALKSLIDLGDPFHSGDLAETAGVMANLDLIICCDTAVAHLAGALGRPVWIALGSNPDWRWPDDRSDTPWYSSMRLFRRDPDGSWLDVLFNMADKFDQYRKPSA